MLAEFRRCYPQGSLVSELIMVEHGRYIVRASVQVEGVTLATGLSISNDLEESEDKAIQRALALLDLGNKPTLSISSATSPTPLDKAKSGQNFYNTSLKNADLNSLNNSSFNTNISEKLSHDISPNIGERKLNVTYNSSNSSSNSGLTNLAPEPTKSINNNASETKIQMPAVVDNAEMIALINFELNRTGWTTERGRDYLLSTYGKKSRHMLTDKELADFLAFLRQQSAP